MTTVLMVSGSWPPEACGVGDDTEKLCRELERTDIDVVRFGDDGLSRVYSRETIRQASQTDCDIVHIQYPTAGYGRSLTPSALPASMRNKPVVVTLHEYSVFRWYRRAWFAPFARNCAARIFTTEEERRLFESRFPSRGGLDMTVGIASNIAAVAKVAREANRVAYFGLIVPHKGIEAFLDLCEIARAASSDLTFELIGAIPEMCRGYAETVLQRASACSVQLTTDMPDDAVARRLATATFAYLPYPDGASGKRGTLAAALVNNLVVVTRHSDITPDWIRTATLDAKGHLEALKVLTRLHADTRRLEAAVQQSALASSRFRWDEIALRHADLYRSLLEGADKRRRAAAAPSASASLEARMAS
jgi:glycosyltransferase involved in cell wall biosynthesis